MKIVLIHHRYYPASGPERYLFNIKRLLEQNGHEIVPFSINYDLNEQSEYSKYFVEPVGSPSNFHLGNQPDIQLSDKLKVIKNFYYNKEAYIKLNSLIENEKPDIAYVLTFFDKLSTSIIDACKKKNIPVVLRLSDYNLLCAKNIFYRSNKICEKCLSNQIHSVLNKCVQDSYVKSGINYLVRNYLYLKKFQRKIDAIITPSLFMKGIFKGTAKFKNNRIVHIPTFINKVYKEQKVNVTSNISFCYIGRIAEDKGIKTIIEAFKILNDKGYSPDVSIFGDYKNDYGSMLIRLVEEWKLTNISFEGYLSEKQLLKKLKQYSFSIVPSVWYDNMPNSLIESQSLGMPVIASSIGSLKELITNEYNGFLFKPGDASDLANRIYSLKSIDKHNLMKLKENSFKWVTDYCSEQVHYNELIGLFNNLIRENNENITKSNN